MIIKEKEKEIMKELFNYNLENNSLGRLNILITIFFVSALILSVLIFHAPNFLSKIITLISALITWIVGVGYGIIRFSKRAKELTNHRNKIQNLLNLK